MTHLFVRRSSFEYAFASIAVLFFFSSLIGCGSPSSSTMKPSATEVASSRGAETTLPAVELPSMQSVPPSATTPSATTVAPVPAVSPEPALQSKAPEPKVPEPKSAVAEWKKPEANVSPEQAALWKPVVYEQLQLLALHERREGGLITCSAASLDGKTLIVAGTGLSLWSVLDEKPRSVLVEQIPGSEAFYTAIRVSPDGKWFAVADSLGSVTVWSMVDEKSLVTKKVANGKIVDLSIATDGKWISTTSFDSVIYTWSADRLEAHGKFKVKTNGVKRIEFSSAKNLIVLGENASLWNVDDGTLVKDIEGDRYNYSLSRSSDAKTIFLGGEKVLKQFSGDELTHVASITGNFASEEWIAARNDSSRIATLNGNSLRIWDGTTKKTIQWMDVYGESTSGLHWMEDGKFLVQPSSIGLIRVWGTLPSESVAGKLPNESASKTPASSTEAKKILDVRMLPSPPESQAILVSDSSASYTVPLTVADTKLYYRNLLGILGWMEGPEQTPNYGSLDFRKKGFLLSLSTFEAEATKTTVNLDFGSNLDMQTLPRTEGKLESVFATPHMLMYSVDKDLLSLEVDLIRKMRGEAWTLFSRLHAAQREEPESRNMAFVKGGAHVLVSIQKSPLKPEMKTIQYTRFLSPNALPIPDDSDVVELESVPKPYLVAVTQKSIEETTAFYDAALAEQGWRACKTGRVLKEDGNWLPYVQGAKDLLIGVRKMKDVGTLVMIGDRLQNSSWQLKVLLPAKDEVGSKAPGDLLQAADLPIIKGAKSIRYDSTGKTIEYSVESTPLADIAAQYTEAMTPLGWEAEKGGLRSEDYTFFQFKKGKKEIAFRAHFRNGKADINMQGDGLDWTKPLPGGQKRISYLSWLREHKYPASLKRLGEFELEMKEIPE